jgi:hypothetical protein
MENSGMRMGGEEMGEQSRLDRGRSGKSKYRLRLRPPLIGMVVCVFSVGRRPATRRRISRRPVGRLEKDTPLHVRNPGFMSKFSVIENSAKF